MKPAQAGHGPPWVLVVAGADSSGRAGVSADREAIEAQGLGLQSIVSAWTAQDSGGVSAVSPVSPEVWLCVAREALGARPSALKFGLLAGVPQVHAAAQLTSEALAMGLPVVLDPVLSSSSGHDFLGPEGQAVLRTELFTQSVVVTPNLPEAARLLGEPEPAPGVSWEARVPLAARLLELGPRAVLLKGGHGAEDPVRDLLLEQGQAPCWHTHSRLPGRSMGGSGCRYASTVAGALARSLALPEAAELAGRYVAARLQESPGTAGSTGPA